MLHPLWDTQTAWKRSLPTGLALPTPGHSQCCRADAAVFLSTPIFTLSGPSACLPLLHPCTPRPQVGAPS